MCSLENFSIELKGMKSDSEHFDFPLKDDYFQLLEAPEVSRGTLMAALDVRKVGDAFELNFHVVGDVIIPCDLCLDDMLQHIDATDKLIARFGDDNDESGDDIIVAETEGTLDVSWIIYEIIALAIPVRHVHAPGECNADMLRHLEEHAAKQVDEAEPEEDPRWAALKQLKENN